MLRGRDRLGSPDAAEEIRRLEELWEAPAAGEPELPRRSRWLELRRRALSHPGWILATVWLLFLGSLLAAAPASPPSYTPPLWVDLVVSAFWLALVVSALAAVARWSFVAYSASLAAAGACVGLAIACTVTDHHTSGWWAYELGGALVLGGLSVLGLRLARASRSRG